VLTFSEQNKQNLLRSFIRKNQLMIDPSEFVAAFGPVHASQELNHKSSWWCGRLSVNTWRTVVCARRTSTQWGPVSLDKHDDTYEDILRRKRIRM